MKWSDLICIMACIHDIHLLFIQVYDTSEIKGKRQVCRNGVTGNSWWIKFLGGSNSQLTTYVAGERITTRKKFIVIGCSFQSHRRCISIFFNVSLKLQRGYSFFSLPVFHTNFLLLCLILILLGDLLQFHFSHLITPR